MTNTVMGNVGQPRKQSLLKITAILFLCMPCIQPNVNAETDWTSLEPLNMDVVLTPARLKQNKRDVPASVTVISAETIKKLNIQDIPEALRLVPGMAVGRESGNVYRIEYHGTNGLVPRRMQILIDGVSYFRAGLALVFWKELPVDIKDVQRIEVTRSPSAASYGANSYFAVVNIITKHPTDVIGYRTNATAGSLSTKNAFLSYGGQLEENIHHRISVTHRYDSGYDYDENGNDREDDTSVNAMDYRSHMIFKSRSELDFFANFSRSSVNSNDGDENQISLPENEIIDRNLSGQFTSQLTNQNQLKIKAFYNHLTRDKSWNTCYPAILFSEEMRAMHLANPEYAETIIEGGTPSGGSAEDDALADAVFDLNTSLGPLASQLTCGEVNEDYEEKRVGYEIQDTHVFSDELRMVAGLGFGRNTAYSKAFLNGEVTIDSQYLFANVEYQPSDNMTFNIGSMWENEEHHTDGIAYSPRAAFNYHFTKNHTVRLVYARAIRTPDMLESDRNWNYTMRNMTPTLYTGATEGLFYYNAQSDNMLKPEQITAKEISYYARLPQLGITWDVKLFREELDDLISEKLEFFNFHPTNSNSATLQGVEVQIEYQPKSRLSGYLAYAYMDNESSNSLERSLYARHSGSAFVNYELSPNWETSLAYYGSSSIGTMSFDRLDLILSGTFTETKTSKWKSAFKVQHYGSERSSFIIDQNEIVENVYDDSTHYFISLSWEN